MYRPIRGLKEDLCKVRPAREDPAPPPMRPSQRLSRPCRDLRHPVGTHTLAFGFALLSRQAT
jgi:hypothetical protein